MDLVSKMFCKQTCILKQQAWLYSYEIKEI